MDLEIKVGIIFIDSDYYLLLDALTEKYATSNQIIKFAI
jgi:hypothetical protein